MNKAEDYLQAAQIHPVGEAAIMVSFGNVINPELLRCARALVKALEEDPFPGIQEFEASYTGVTIFYDPLVLAQKSQLPEDPVLSKGYREAAMELKKRLKKLEISEAAETEKVRIPVCYGGEFGPDLEYVAEYHHMTPEEVVKIHTSGDYLVYMIGFAPGFPYIGGLPEAIATPRRDTPRLVIPKGTVGIAGTQTGAYPLETPGGWQLIGRTPLELFRPQDPEHPSVLKAGDKVEFYSITPEEYAEIAAKEKGDAVQ